jgi:ribosomal protein S18 acetylase RimI-like enzyme
MKVRALRPEESGSVLELWRIAEATPSVTDTVAEVQRMAQRPDAAFLVAEIDGNLVGSVIATFDGWRGHVYRLVVHPEHRRRGVARLLVRQAEEALSRWGARRITALVENDHPWAMSFWESVGYTFQPRIARFVLNLEPPGDAVE